jgi:hypothetical protein
MGNAVAYYLWPPVWVGDARPEHKVPYDISVLGQEVYRKTLSSGIGVRVDRDGMFTFDFSGWPAGQAPSEDLGEFESRVRVTATRTQVLNAHLVCVYTAMFRLESWTLAKMLVTPVELIKRKSLDSPNMGMMDTRVTWLLMARYPVSYSSQFPPQLDPRLSSRGALVTIRAVEESFRLLSHVLAHENEDALVLVDLFARSCKTFEEGHYSVSLTESWTVTEKMLDVLWSRFVKAGTEQTVDIGGQAVPMIDKRRKDFLKDDRSFSASVRSEVLCFTGKLPHDLYLRLGQVRKARNQWIHDVEPVSMQTAHESAKVAEEMLRLVEGVDLYLPLQARL